MEKITKRQMYTAMINYAENGSFSFETDEGTMVVAPDEIVTFAENEISLLDKKAAKAKAEPAAPAVEAKAEPAAKAAPAVEAKAEPAAKAAPAAEAKTAPAAKPKAKRAPCKKAVKK